MPLNVTFRAGTLAEYNALQTKDEGTLYFIIDKNMIYRGTTLVTSRYLISGIASSPGEVSGFRLIDQTNGTHYDIPYLADVNNMLQSNLSLRFHETFIERDSDLLEAIGAEANIPGSGDFEAGMVYRMSDRLYEEGSVERLDSIDLNPGQFAKPEDVLTVKRHDLVVAIKTHRSSDEPFTTNHECFAVIPVDLVNLITSPYSMTANAVVLGDGGKGIKPLSFGGANKILRTNGSNNGVEWVSPETVQNVMVWENIAE